MKNDMRITYPLWQMGSIAILMAFVLVIGLSSVFTKFDDGGFEFSINFQGELGVIWGGILLLFIIYLVLFTWNVAKHNRKMPEHKIIIFSLKPQEYMEDDELFQEFTKRATKKVYSYFVLSIPFMAGLCVALQVGTIGMVMGLLLLSMGQYLIYYKEIRKYVGVDE